ncbi:hypothetical protein HELRODRAFT_147159, partial [Helobdella robusta]|uniref:Suppressor of white apricot N-terminal domain-containing protein n=1 Tax=Helobdella robusta TaxID=6412 RepID=T1EJX5_HELRO
DDFDDLCVVGYQCNIFRDDEKAVYIDENRHLISWMGDESILIDRYERRGHLTELDAERLN